MLNLDLKLASPDEEFGTKHNSFVESYFDKKIILDSDDDEVVPAPGRFRPILRHGSVQEFKRDYRQRR